MEEIKSAEEDVSIASDLSEQEKLIEALEKEQESMDDESQPNLLCGEKSKPIKRDRVEDDEEEWETVLSKRKKDKAGKNGDKCEIYLSSNESMPKQFALAKIFKNIGVNVDKVRYVNPFKIRVDVPNEAAVDQIESCKEIIDRGWRIHRAMEVNLSYGVIKDVDLELKDDDILESISCQEPAILVSVNRLLRRKSGSDGWEPSESVRLCFKGSFRPASINVDGLRIRVDPYFFPVSQCSHCWALGHTAKRCPSRKVVCPKCSDKHDNCETSSFKCVNCGGNHMALWRSCPAYRKEKRLRELMAEFNCTYRRALTLYVPMTYPGKRGESPQSERVFQTTRAVIDKDAITPGQKPSFAEVVTRAIIHRDIKKTPTSRPPKQYVRDKSAEPFIFESGVRPKITKARQDITEQDKREKEVKFGELTSRLKEIFFLKGITMQDKVQRAIKCCIEWVILILVENISDWPVLKAIMDYIGL